MTNMNKYQLITSFIELSVLNILIVLAAVNVYFKWVNVPFVILAMTMISFVLVGFIAARQSTFTIDGANKIIWDAFKKASWSGLSTGLFLGLLYWML